MDPATLMRMYPHLDWLMAETICKLHAAGTLQAMCDEWKDVERQHAPPATVVEGAVSVETPTGGEEKNALVEW